MYYTQLIAQKKRYVSYTTNRIEKVVCIIHNYNVAKCGMYYTQLIMQQKVVCIIYN